MTAEIAIMNKSALVLAADSAITITGSTNKIYNTVNKLFTLSKRHPVGIMVYGNAEFMNRPYETLIKVFREKLGIRSHPSIYDYCNEFLAYLVSDSICSDIDQRKNVSRLARDYFDGVKTGIVRNIISHQRNHGKCSQAQIRKFVEQVIRLENTALEKQPFADGFSVDCVNDVLRVYSAEITKARSTLDRDLPLTSTQIAALIPMAAMALCKGVFSNYRSEIVIAGFGEDDLFPHLIHVETDGAFLGKHKIRTPHDERISTEGFGASIIPFAQGEMVGRFMEGVDENYQHYLEVQFRRLLDNFGASIVDALNSSKATKLKVREAVSNSADANMTDFHAKCANYRRTRFVDRILDVVVNMPKEEIAALADALVNLTSVKRRVSAESETVGGPIDVAVISKGDGFIWIKRKHYFDPKYNPQFGANYFRGVSQ